MRSLSVQRSHVPPQACNPPRRGPHPIGEPATGTILHASHQLSSCTKRSTEDFRFNLKLIERRDRDHRAAHKFEIDEALEEQVEILNLRTRV